MARTHTSTRRLSIEALEDRCLLSGGVLDPMFGNGGLLTTSFGSSDSKANAVAIYPNAGTANDGKTVVAGSNASRTTTFALARYNLDGTLDQSFGGTGLVTKPNTIANVVKIQPDGKIVAAGLYGNDFAVARYNVDGSLDSTFGRGKAGKGVVITDINQQSWDAGQRLALQPDGKIVVAGWTAAANTNTSDLALVRYNADGSLDATFGAGGIVVKHFAEGSVSQSFGAGSAMDMTIDPGTTPDDPNAGKIVVDVMLSGKSGNTWAVVRFNTNGSLDTSFGSGAGYLTTASAFIVAVQPDDRIVTAGIASNGASTGYDVRLARLNPDGTPDASFGAGGIVVTPLPGDQMPRSLTIQPDGKIVVAGNENTSDFMVARYNAADGGLDTSFGVGGIAVTTGVKFSYGPVDVALEPDGRIVLAGTQDFHSTGNYHFALARFLATGPQIGSLTADPNPATAGSSVTLTATNVVPLNPGSTVTQVAFYVDSNGDGVLDAGDALLGYGTQSSTGTWAFPCATAGWASGTHTLFAQAQDSYGVLSDPLALTLQLA
jgi:uncharacterized delta-60 repeat protein